MRFSLLLLLFAAAAPALSAQPTAVVRTFEEGNQLYEEGDYAAALDAYRRVLDAGYASGALYYNMGNAFFRAGELGQAVRYYEKARPLLPDPERLQHNLVLARDRLPRATEAPRPSFPARVWQRVAAWAGSRAFFFLGLALYLAAAARIAYRLYAGRPRPRLTAAALLGGLLLLALVLAASAYPGTPDRAVVLAGAAALRTQPALDAANGDAADNDAADENAAYEGSLVDVLERRGGWARVRLAGGRTGWLPAEAVGRI